MYINHLPNKTINPLAKYDPIFVLVVYNTAALSDRLVLKSLQTLCISVTYNGVKFDFIYLLERERERVRSVRARVTHSLLEVCTFINHTFNHSPVL